MQMLRFIFLFSSTSIFAIQNGPVASKINSSGYTPPDMARSERCDLFEDRIEVIRSFGQGMILKEVHPFKRQGSLIDLVNLVNLEKEETFDNYLCDAPSTTMVAYQKTSEGVKKLMLYTTGGCGSPAIRRQGTASERIQDILAIYCPKTRKLIRP